MSSASHAVGSCRRPWLLACIALLSTLSADSARMSASRADPKELLAALAKLKEVKKVQKNTTVRPPTDIVGLPVDFLNLGAREPIGKVAETFLGWGADVLLVDFFAFSCTNCLRTIPHLRKLYAELQKFGFEILAFARPEFDFEHETSGVEAWIKRNKIEYPVVMDNSGSNWEAWGVTGWPTNFVVIPDGRKEFKGQGLLYQSLHHVGDRNHHLVDNEVLSKLKRLSRSSTVDLIKKKKWPAAGTESFTDVELFFGKQHRYKNAGDGGCDKEARACSLGGPQGAKGADALKLGLPLPQLGEFTIYGAGWCQYCRKAKALLEAAKEAGLAEFAYHDVDKFGGNNAVHDALQLDAAELSAKLDARQLGGVPEGYGPMPADYKTIPVVFEGAEFLGGYSQLVARLEGRLDLDKVAAKQDVAVVEYKKNGNQVTSLLEPGAWSLDGEALTALSDGAAVEFRFSLQQPPTTTPGPVSVSAYAVVKPPEGGGWLKVASSGRRMEPEFAGRHYLGSYEGLEASDKVTVSKGTRVYVLWLSTEPYSEDAVA